MVLRRTPCPWCIGDGLGGDQLVPWNNTVYQCVSTGCKNIMNGESTCFDYAGGMVERDHRMIQPMKTN